MTKYEVEVYRDERWWMIRIPALDGYTDDATGSTLGTALTQARRYADIETEARDYIAVVTDCAPSTAEVSIRVDLGDGTDVVAEAAEAQALKARAEELESEALAMRRHLAQRLAQTGIPLRDIGEILGVAYQRAGQLVQEAS